MQPITHYEVYQAVGDQWSLVARYSGREQDKALAHARNIEEVQKRPVAVTEESESLASTQLDTRIIHRSMLGGLTIRPPSNQTDITSRMFMVVLTGLALGAVIATLTSAVVSSALGGGGQTNVIILGSFLVGALIGGSAIFRVYVPVGLIIWNTKDSEARKRTIMTLAHGTVVASAYDPVPESVGLGPGMTPTAAADESSNFTTHVGTIPPPPAPPPAPAATPAPAPAPAAPVQAQEPAKPAAESPPVPVDAEAVTATATSALDSLMGRILAQLEAFTDKAMAEVVAARPEFAPAERQAVNLYLAGAAQTAADRNALDPSATAAMQRFVVERSGLSTAEADQFLAELENDADRPRFRRMIDSGAAALAATIDGGPPPPSLHELLTTWNDPANQVTGSQQVTFLLTDIAGSTALTSQIGNAGAQRVVRAHNAIVRAAAKAFKGREVKHTGDGILLLFPDPAGAARAAMDIQQEATNYAKDNPAAPLVLRVGVHQGDAVFEDGDYYGTAVSVVNGVCGVIGNEEIACTASIRKKVAGPAFRFEDMGIRTVKGSPTGIEVSKLLWEPKRSTAKGAIEYRQIGTAPTGGDAS